MTTDRDMARRIHGNENMPPDDMEDYVKANHRIAAQVCSHDGTLFDMDCMVDMSRILGYPVSWELYHYYNEHLEYDLMTECESPDAPITLANLAETFEKTRS